MHEYIILFFYHKKNDPATWKHYALMQHHNPGVPIIPLSNGDSLEMPGTVDVSKFDCSRWDNSNQWASSDTMLYRWFLNREISAKRYVAVEYDVYCETSYPDFLADVWDKPFSAQKCFTYEYWPQWDWFKKEYHLLPDELKPYAACVCPFGFLLFSHEALEAISKNAAPYKLFSEFRIGTTARKLGIPATQMYKALNTINWTPKEISKQPYPTIYHPVKSMVPVYGKSNV